MGDFGSVPERRRRGRGETAQGSEKSRKPPTASTRGRPAGSADPVAGAALELPRSHENQTRRAKCKSIIIINKIIQLEISVALQKGNGRLGCRSVSKLYKTFLNKYILGLVINKNSLDMYFLCENVLWFC